MGSRIITATELEKMTSAQRQAAFDASIVTDLDKAPPELVPRTRRRIEQMIAESDSTSSTWATIEFFADLDRQLPAERGAHGEPSANDFQVFELLVIVERFSIGFWDLPELIPGRSDYRVMIATGVLLRGYSVVGQLAPDGAVELVALEIDLDIDWS